jgi:hypothetical protein
LDFSSERLLPPTASTTISTAISAKPFDTKLSRYCLKLVDTLRATAKPKKRVMSAEARKRIADVQRKRWGIIYLTPLFDMIAT